jgi:hypothetical protein
VNAPAHAQPIAEAGHAGLFAFPYCEIHDRTNFTVTFNFEERSLGGGGWWVYSVLDDPNAIISRSYADSRYHRTSAITTPLKFDASLSSSVILDATGVGDPIYDDLARRYGNIEPFKFTTVSKTELIQRLIVAIEQQKIGWPEEWKVLTNELQRYEYEISARGHLSYNAPAGFHDDCVIALALANHRRWQTESCGPLLPIPPIHDRRSRWFPRPREL